MASASAGKFLGLAQDLVSVYGGTRLLKGDVIWIHQPQTSESEVAHGTRRRANIQRVPGSD